MSRYSEGGTAQVGHKGGFKSAREFYRNEKTGEVIYRKGGVSHRSGKHVDNDSQARDYVERELRKGR